MRYTSLYERNDTVDRLEFSLKEGPWGNIMLLANGVHLLSISADYGLTRHDLSAAQLEQLAGTGLSVCTFVDDGEDLISVLARADDHCKRTL